MEISAINNSLNFKKINQNFKSKAQQTTATNSNLTNFSSASSNAIKSMNSANVHFSGNSMPEAEKKFIQHFVSIEKPIRESLNEEDKKEATEEYRQKALKDMIGTYRQYENESTRNKVIKAKDEVLQAIEDRQQNLKSATNYKALIDIVTSAHPSNKEAIKKALSLKNEYGPLSLNTVSRLCCHETTKDAITGEDIDRRISPFEAKIKLAAYENYVLDRGIQDDDFIGQWPLITSVLRNIVINRGEGNYNFYAPQARSAEKTAEIIKRVNPDTAEIFVHTLKNSNLGLSAIMSLYCHENGHNVDDATAIQRYKALVYMQTAQNLFKGDVDEAHKVVTAIKEIVPSAINPTTGKEYTEEEIQNRVDTYMHFAKKFLPLDEKKVAYMFKRHMQLQAVFGNATKADMQEIVKEYIATRTQITGVK